jgi:hypothetical protein
MATPTSGKVRLSVNLFGIRTRHNRCTLLIALGLASMRVRNTPARKVRWEFESRATALRAVVYAWEWKLAGCSGRFPQLGYPYGLNCWRLDGGW